MMNFKRISILATPIILIIIISSIWVNFIKPTAIEMIEKQIPKINSKQDIIEISVGKIDLSLLKLQLQANDIVFKIKNQDLAPVTVKEMIAQLDVFDLIVGQINISKLYIDSFNIGYIFDTNGPEKKIKIPTELIFEYLSLIPIDHILISESRLQVEVIPNGVIAAIHFPNLNISNKKNELRITSTLNTSFSKKNENQILLQSQFAIGLKKETLRVDKLQIKTLDSEVQMSAEISDIENLLIKPAGTVDFESKINLENLRTLGLMLFPQKNRLPTINGLIHAMGKVTFDSLEKQEGQIKLTTTQVNIDQFKLGQAQIQAELTDKSLKLSDIKVEHPSGLALIKEAKIERSAPYNFSAAVELQDFDLQKLFSSIGLSQIPASLSGQGRAQCKGEFSSFFVNCTTQTDIANLWVKPDKNDTFNIIKINKINLNGEFKVDSKAFSYKTNLQVGSSTGVSSGIVSFEEGFNIDFETGGLSFTDVESLADLDFNGVLKIKGNTQGDSSHGTIKSKMTYDQAILNKFKIGQFSSELSYQKGHLELNQISGTTGQSEFTGFIDFNFKNNTLEGLISSNKLFAEDVVAILNDKFAIPIKISGNGRAHLIFNGPFDFWKLKYDLNSSFQSGNLAGEGYSQANLDLTSDGNTIFFKNVSIKKLKSTTKFDGTIDTTTKEPKFNLKVKANPFLIEEFDHVVIYAPAISGTGYADGEINGPISSPIIKSNFTLKQVTYDKVEYPNSQGTLSIDKNFLKFSGQLFGRQIQSDVVWPWNASDELSLKLLLHDLNPLFLLPLISIPQPSSEFTSKLNAEVNLTSKTRSLLSANGFINVEDFSISRGKQFLKLDEPVRMNFKSGLTQMDKFKLTGDNKSYVILNLANANSERLRFNLTADIQAKLFHFLIPFVQTISGNLAVKSQFNFYRDSFEMLGEGEITDGNLVMKGFPTAIENINTPIEFSKTNIFLHDITGKVGQSDVTGFGQLQIVGPKEVRVNLRAIADNLEINFPDQILTAGKANLLFSGNWLPYNLKIDYAVSHGLVEKDFESDSGLLQTLKASPFLPAKQIEQLSPSLSLDIRVDATKGLIIKNKLVEGEANGVLNISGSPESPIIKGRIDIKPGSKLIFKDKPFNVQTAQINFQTTDQINPDIYISANSRVSDYDINLLIQGPSKSPNIKPTSQPPLSEPDIFSLLALGVTSQSDQQLSSETQQKQTGLEVLAAISNQSQLNKKIQDKLGLTVQLAPSIDSTKNIAVPKVVVSKKLSNKFNASYSKPFTGNDQNQEIKLQYLYDNSWSFLLNYQNKDSSTEDQTTTTNTNTKSIWGIDLEYRDEFK